MRERRAGNACCRTDFVMLQWPERNPKLRELRQNRKARRDYFIEETYEAGIVLTGTETKSLRNGRANINDSYARERGGEICSKVAISRGTGLPRVTTTNRSDRENSCCIVGKFPD